MHAFLFSLNYTLHVLTKKAKKYATNRITRINTARNKSCVCRAGPRLASVRVVCRELFGTGMSDLGQFGSDCALWDKFGTFSNHISIYFRSPCQNLLNYDLKKSRICSIYGQPVQIWAKIWHPVMTQIVRWRRGTWREYHLVPSVARLAGSLVQSDNFSR